MDLLNKLFGFDAKTMTIRKEIIAGITTFLTMSYILAVSPSLLGQTGMAWTRALFSPPPS